MTINLKKTLLAALCLTFLLSAVIVSHASEKSAPEENAALEFQHFFYALNLIRMHYVDPEQVSYKTLFQKALQGLMKELDPYCAYETEKEFNKTKSETRGERVGIGVYVVLKHGNLEILGIDPESPAEKAGLKTGDLIQKIDGESFGSKKLEEAGRMLRGTIGETITLNLYRPALDKHLEIQVTYEKFQLRSVTGAKILDKTNGTGYVRITQFTNKTASELDQALVELKKQDLKLLIVDLRNNPGGLVSAAVQVCSRFLPPGKAVVSLVGRDPQKTKHFATEKCVHHFPDQPLVLLVNYATASAAEIMTACLRDYKRAVIIGERTFGKGVVQNLIPLNSKEALRLTTAHYYTPSKQAIQDQGITPDIPVRLTPARRIALANQLNLYPGEITPKIRNAVRDIQLERAIEVLKAVKLFRDAHKTNEEIKKN